MSGFILHFTVLTNQLTNSMVQTLSWEASKSSARQEIQRLLWNPKFHHRFHNSPPPVPMLSWTNIFTSPSSHFFKIHFNIIVSSTPSFSKWSLSLHAPLQSHICVTSPAYLINLHLINRIILDEQLKSWGSSLCRRTIIKLRVGRTELVAWGR